METETQHDQNFPMEGNPLSRTLRITFRDQSKKVNHLNKVI